MSAPLMPQLTPVQRAAQEERRATLTRLLDTLDEIRQALVVNPRDVAQLRRLSSTSDHLRDMLRINREAVQK